MAFTGARQYKAWVCEDQRGLTFDYSIPGDIGRHEDDGTCAICNQVDSSCRWVTITDAVNLNYSLTLN